MLVVAHELGHFFVAKAFGVRVDEFGVGYPPRAKRLFTWRGTLFTLNWLPFGGFVKIFGEETSEDSDVAQNRGLFSYQKMWKRLLIIAAGIIANLFLAAVLYAVSFGIGFLGDPNDFPGSVPLGPVQTIVTGVLPESPAHLAGLERGDAVTKISAGESSVEIKEIEQIAMFVKAHGTDPVTLSIVRGSTAMELTAVPELDSGTGIPMIGIGLASATQIRLPFFRAIGAGFTYTAVITKSTVLSLGMLVGGAFRGDSGLLSQVSGPVGIATIAGQAFTLGIGSFLAFVALISVNLAVINLLPFPALDGGRLILELFSRKGKSKIPVRVVSAVNQVGFLVLIIFMLYVTYQDIRHLVA